MEKSQCTVCLKKTKRQCGVCESFTCKTCAHNLGEDYFKFLSDTAEILNHGYYCHACFQEHVEETYDDYNRILEQAENMSIYLSLIHI